MSILLQNKKYKTIVMKKMRRLLVVDCKMDDKVQYTCSLDDDIKTSGKLKVIGKCKSGSK